MLIKERKINGVFEIQLKPQKDSRGFFMRVYDEKLFEKYRINKNWVQENHSFSSEKNTIRGMHFQFPPHAEAKLIRVINGAIYDVHIDLRKNSINFGQWDSIQLSRENNKMLFIPRGIAHGFCALTKNCEILYKMDNYYDSDFEGSILWNDQEIGIKWPVDKPILSEKDLNAKSFREFVKKSKGL